MSAGNDGNVLSVAAAFAELSERRRCFLEYRITAKPSEHNIQTHRDFTVTPNTQPLRASRPLLGGPTQREQQARVLWTQQCANVIKSGGRWRP